MDEVNRVAQTQKEFFGAKDCFNFPREAGFFSEKSGQEMIRVLSDPDSDYALKVRHIARKLSNNLVGLALGSGAALGFAHLGVLKVLEREKIPIDCIAGSSMGAVVGAFYAVGTPVEEMVKIAAALNRRRFFYLTDIDFFPWRGLVKGRRITKYLKKYLKDTTFEETKTPLILTGTNISRRTSDVMNSGSILKALRASISIPGIFHPVKSQKDVIVDGGILDPLPIRPMLDMGVDKIIAVDVLPTPEDIQEKRHFQMRLEMTRDNLVARKNAFVRGTYRMRKWFNKMLQPNFIDVVMNSMQAMEHEIVDSLASEADVLIRPSSPHISWVEFHRHEELIQLGEEAAEAMTDELHALVKQQSI